VPDPSLTQWPTLSPTERRLLGVLVEKQKTTPDVYPMSLNALVTGSNQKSNREPVLSLTGDEIEETLLGLQQQALATRVDSGRVEKWRHLLYEAWHVSKEEIAVLAELLLRGPQTEGELRGHVSRLEPVPDLDALRALLQPMSQRGLVVYLTPEGRRGTMLTHGFHPPEELERLRSRTARESVADEPARPRTAAPDPDRLAALTTRVDELAVGLAQLRETVAALETQLRSPHSALGTPPPP
jgi:uncharacterized protein YceH (UPF0502 family)